MTIRPPSRTAFAAAAHRAAHQVVEHGRIFSDPLAVKILGRSAEEIGEQARADPTRAGMRFFVSARSRIAEDVIAEGVANRGLTQLVVLGAGLDTFAYRNPHKSLRIFEIDHAGTQAWKRQRLTEAGIAAPEGLTYVAVDFEHDDLMERLAAAGLDPKLRTFFLWLGVVPYLTRQAIETTLKATASLPGGAEIAFDYGEPPDRLPLEMREMHERRAKYLADLGEPFLSMFAPDDLHGMLSAAGYSRIDDMDAGDMIERFANPEVLAAAKARGARRPTAGGHVVIAMTS
ncbi:MAG TPA: class I SAM-dependent methyltransferase [Hyphomonadaceae bacterium]|jgi:methyltransferase (TIGR00027 family)|nr:class I SAM-dependent methyltransferase [Hyphomonadaceae bacterium]